MSSTTLTIEIDGSSVSDPFEVGVVSVQVEEATEHADAATVTARLEADDAGRWRSILDPLVTPKTPFAVELERGTTAYRFEGKSAEVAWDVDPRGGSRLTVKAIDRTLDMNLEEKVTPWRASDSGIAEKILSSYALKAEVTPTPDKADADVHVVMQRATDWGFLRALAAKWGYAVYVEVQDGRAVGVFGPLDPLATPQTELVFGYGGNGVRANVQAQLVAGRDVRGARITPLSTTVVSGADGGTGGAQALRSLGGQTTVLLSPNDVDGEVDPAEAAKGIARKSAFALRLDAEVDADDVGAVVRARRTVAVGGLGDALSGTYLVERVRHKLVRDRHSQQLTLVRNALGGSGGLLA